MNTQTVQRNLRQMPLPGVNMQQMCPLCGCPTRMLGQYSPIWPWGVCRACSLAEPYPCEVYEVDPHTKDRSGLRIKPDSDYAVRERRVVLDNVLRDAVKPRKTEWTFPYKINITLRELRNPIRYGKAEQYHQWHKEAQLLTNNQQLSIPWCYRCGHAHDHKDLHDYSDYCTRCDAEQDVEALYQHRGIFGKDDAETILDRIFKAQPWLFELGVLPDYWFELVARDSNVQKTHIG